MYDCVLPNNGDIILDMNFDIVKYVMGHKLKNIIVKISSMEYNILRTIKMNAWNIIYYGQLK